MLYNLPDVVPIDCSQWDHLFADGEQFAVGELAGCALLSLGHTLCSVTYVIGNAAFVHDTIFMPDSGTARADFPGVMLVSFGKASSAFCNFRRTRDYSQGMTTDRTAERLSGKAPSQPQEAQNPYLKNFDEAKFVEVRKERDRRLPMPTLMLPALQVNIVGGRLPAPENDGRRYLKIPLNAFPEAPWDKSGSFCE